MVGVFSDSWDFSDFVNLHVSVSTFFKLFRSVIITRLLKQSLCDLRKLFLVECIVHDLR